jgi:hypothetical protein
MRSTRLNRTRRLQRRSLPPAMSARVRQPDAEEAPEAITAPASAGSSAAVECPSLVCAICNSHDKAGDFSSHPTLRIPVCMRCTRQLSTMVWTLDEDGSHEWCTLCADGGEMFLCACGRAICHEDCEDVVSEEYLEQCKKQEEWKCFVCDPAPIKVRAQEASRAHSRSRGGAAEGALNRIGSHSFSSRMCAVYCCTLRMSSVHSRCAGAARAMSRVPRSAGARSSV